MTKKRKKLGMADRVAPESREPYPVSPFTIGTA